MSMQIRSCSECGGVLTEAHSNNTHFIYMHFFEQHDAGILWNAANFDNVCILYQIYVSNISLVLQDML